MLHQRETAMSIAAVLRMSSVGVRVVSHPLDSAARARGGVLQR